MTPAANAILPLTRIRPNDVSVLGGMAATGLRLSGWLFGTTLASMGCAVLFFVFVGGFTADGFFAHLANLADRHAGATDSSKDEFVRLVFKFWLGTFCIAGLCRWRLLARIFTGDRHDGR